MKIAIKDACTSVIPIVIAADDLPFVEGVGGVDAYMEFLKSINGFESKWYPDKEKILD